MSMNRQTRMPLCWVLVCLVTMSHVTLAQGPVPRPKFGTWNPPASSAVSYYSILGEIAKPGVYSAEGREVTLQELVQQAGGTTPQAGPAVRLIRQKRIANGVFFNPGGRDVLQPGDVVLIENMHPQPGSANAVTIGMIGVMDRPVIVPMRPDNAQLGTLMLALGQSPELARSVRMIVPSRQPLPSSTSAPLASGTVLVFDSRLLVSGNLPSFPDAIPLARAVEPLPTNVAPPAANPLMSGVPHPPSMSTLPAEIPDTRLPVANAGMNHGEVEATTLPFSNAGQRPQANAASLPVPGSRLQPEPVQPKPPETTRKTVAPKLNPDSEIVPDLNDDDLDIDEGTTIETTAPAGFTFWQMLGIGGTVASLVGLAVLSRNLIGKDSPNIPSVRPDDGIVPASIKTRSAMPAPHMHRPHRRFDMPEESPLAKAPRMVPKPISEIVPEAPVVPQQEPHDLAELLAMRGPIETESVVLPHGLKLRRSPFEAMPFFRVDEAAQLPGAPHEKPVTAETPQRSLDAAAEMRIPAPHFAAAPRAAITPAAVFAEPAMIGGTAIERALHQLQRGKLS